MPAIGAYCICGLDNVVNCVGLRWSMSAALWLGLVFISFGVGVMYGLCISVNGLVVCAARYTSDCID